MTTQKHSAGYLLANPCTDEAVTRGIVAIIHGQHILYTDSHRSSTYAKKQKTIHIMVTEYLFK